MANDYLYYLYYLVTFIGTPALCYLIGSIPFGLILIKFKTGKDIRRTGSGNIGATNVLRSGHTSLAILTLLLDFLKGASVILLFNYFTLSDFFEATDSSIWKALFNPTNLHLGLFAILGHCFPIWLKFKGGKGVATTFGVLFAAVPWAGFLAAVTWGIVAGFTRYSSLAALSAVALTPLFTFIYYGAAPAIITILIALLVIWRHKENIQRLTAGTESKIGASKKKENDESAADTE